MSAHNNLSVRNWGQVSVLGVVLLFHIGVVYFLYVQQVISPTGSETSIYVDLIAQPASDRSVELKPLPSTKLSLKEKPILLTNEKPIISPNDYAVPAPREDSRATAVQAPQMPQPVGPVALGGELSVSCPDRSAPTYPRRSIQRGETGKVILKVELNETGQVSLATLQSSSGFALLDEAAIAAVRTWRCTPAIRNGQPVKALAYQPFNFILQGN